ncbi:hypothetical protein ABZ470_34795 [Streptosporangium sp. NPDC020072]|uniref:Uncharacterized protein n=1 Tax=Streptosporangium jomthongense TaxID=1193683 RepID=A0ABV8EZB4_9ACTN
MPRRFVALATAALACFGALAVSATPAQAAVLEVVYSPLSLGEYCAAQVNPYSTIGFYNGGLGCYRWNNTGGTTYTGSGSASAACAHFHPTYVSAGYAQGGSQALICRYTV